MEWIAVVVIFVFVVVAFFIKHGSSTLGYRLRGPLFSPAERSFFGVLQQAASGNYVVFGKVRVADVLSPEKGLNRSNWQIAFNKISSKHFDFVLCDKSDLSVVAVIELDDKSHRSKKAQNRDAFLESACQSAGLALVRFPAQKSYQIPAVKEQVQSALEPALVELGT